MTKPDYEGFVRHIWELDAHNVLYSERDLRELAEKYHTPLPCDEDCALFRHSDCESKEYLCDKQEKYER
jgi:hypothetical protein